MRIPFEGEFFGIVFGVFLGHLGEWGSGISRGGARGL